MQHQFTNNEIIEVVGQAKPPEVMPHIANLLKQANDSIEDITCK